MTHHRFRRLFLAASAVMASALFAASGATYRVIANLPSLYQEPGKMVEGSVGVFVSQAGSSVIFSITKRGMTTTLTTFPDPPYIVSSNPGAIAANGLLYSSLEEPGSGNVFSVSLGPGSEKTYPAQNLIMVPISANLPDGNLFGVAYTFSNAASSLATVDLNGYVRPFYQFPSTDTPGFPVYHSDGNYYGMADSSHTSTYFYRATPSGSLTKIANLPFVGGSYIQAFPGAGLLVQATDGNFYGIQQGAGCPGQHAAVFKLNTSGQFTILHDFGCNDVTSLIEGSDGKLYGAANRYSVLFSLTTSGVYTPEFQMNGADGLCPCYLLQGSDGIIYGSATGGGTTGAGVIFALDAGLPVPKPQAARFSPKSGAPGTRVLIWGYNLFGASVTFNGVPAAKAVNSGPNYVWVTVPQGATTGPITVTTSGGASTTRASFTVN